MRLVYIASPYAGDIERNTEAARQYCRWAAEQGVAPVASHLLAPQFLREDVPSEREMGCAIGLRILESCDELWWFGDIVTPGIAAEIAEAKRLAIPIRHITEIELQGGIQMPYGVWATRSAASSLRAAEAWLKNDGEPVTFDTMKEAREHADEMNRNSRSTNVHYYAKDMPQDLGEQQSDGLKMSL
jgi:hypothetical protein